MQVTVKHAMIIPAMISSAFLNIGIHIGKCWWWILLFQWHVTIRGQHIDSLLFLDSIFIIIDIALLRCILTIPIAYSLHWFILHLRHEVFNIRDKHTTKLPLTLQLLPVLINQSPFLLYEVLLLLYFTLVHAHLLSLFLYTLLVSL